MRRAEGYTLRTHPQERPLRRVLQVLRQEARGGDSPVHPVLLRLLQGGGGNEVQGFYWLVQGFSQTGRQASSKDVEGAQQAAQGKTV